MLEKKKRSIKRKDQAPLESNLAIRGKILRLGASSPSSTAKEQGSSDQVSARGLVPFSMAEVSKVVSPKNTSSRTAEPPVEVLPISIQSPSSQNSKLPHTTPKDEGRDFLETKGDEDSLFTDSKLVVGAVSSILRDSNLKRVDALSVEEALALSLQRVDTICLDSSICSFHYCFQLSITFISFLKMATYMKSLARRASFVEGSTRVVKAYKAKGSSLTSEKADLQSRMQRLPEDAVKYESDLKHTTTTKARAADKENKARG